MNVLVLSNINKRLTDEEVELLKDIIKNFYNYTCDDEIYERLYLMSISDIYYFSCLTEISYHKIFSYFMYEYVENNLKLKKGELV